MIRGAALVGEYACRECPRYCDERHVTGAFAALSSLAAVLVLPLLSADVSGPPAYLRASIDDPLLEPAEREA